MTVTNSSEIEINGNKYKIKGNVAGSWENPFPEQFSIGDASYANRRDLSSWIISDLRGGIGVEEMDEAKDWNKCWWTNCIIAYRNHILPPRLATPLTFPGTITATILNGDMEANSNWTGGTQSAVQKYAGSYSWRLTSADATSTQAVNTWAGFWRRRRFTFTCYVWADTASHARITLDDSEGTTSSSNHTGGSSWELLTVSRVIDAAATSLSVGFNQEAAGNNTYFDNAVLTVTNGTGTPFKFVNFNGELYLASNKILSKMNAGRTAFTAVYEFGDAITALIASLNSRLYVYLGDSTNYYWMSTADAFTQSNSALANWGFQYDAKLFKVATTGAVTYSTDPDGGAPTWTSGGAINDIASQIEGFVVGRDASGTYVPYAATNSIIKAYDSATPQWVDTEAVLPNHPIGGKGHAYWNGKLYFSYGLGVKEYYPETGAFLDIGLTERDGIPSYFNGEIVKLLGDTGVKGMFAAVDASIPSGNSYSGLYLYDGNGWQCWWYEPLTANTVMNDIIVSSASSGYAVYWDANGVIYYIDIPRGIQNPDKITQSYGTFGMLVTPWFDAGNPVASKLAKVLADYANGITATETVALQYKIDHTDTDIATGWITMETLEAGESGYNEELFASGAGVSIKAIQFRLDFNTLGSTAKPDIQSLVFYYKKRTGSVKKRVWAMTVICDNLLGTTAKQKVANLKAAIESATDVVFSYHPNDGSTESYYVTVDCNRFSEETGRDYEANYELQLVES